MAKRFYVDEPDVGNMDLPLTGVRHDTKFYDTREEAEKAVEAAELASGNNVVFCVWETE